MKHDKATGAVAPPFEQGVGRAVPKRDNAAAPQGHARKGNRAWVSVGRPRACYERRISPQGGWRNESSANRWQAGKTATRIAARESAGTGGFESRSLAEILVKERVRIAHGGANRFASALGVEGGLTAGKDRHQQLLTRRLLVVCFSAPNGALTGSPKASPTQRSGVKVERGVRHSATGAEENMNIPILINHDQSKPIGFVEVIDGAPHVRFADDVRITLDMAFQIFGDAGLQVLEATEEAGVMLIRHGRILEWSLCPQPAMPNVAGNRPP